MKVKVTIEEVWREGGGGRERDELSEINNNELTVSEKLFIQKYKLITMNFDIPLEKI